MFRLSRVSFNKGDPDAQPEPEPGPAEPEPGPAEPKAGPEAGSAAAAARSPVSSSRIRTGRARIATSRARAIASPSPKPEQKQAGPAERRGLSFGPFVSASSHTDAAAPAVKVNKGFKLPAEV